jgi:hypothetical protein
MTPWTALALTTTITGTTSALAFTTLALLTYNGHQIPTWAINTTGATMCTTLIIAATLILQDAWRIGRKR